MNLDRRTRWIATAMSLAILLSLPLPDFSANLGRIVAVFLLWAANLFFAYCCFFKSSWVFASWVIFLVASAFRFLIMKDPVTLFLLFIWKAWLSVRQKRLSRMSIPKSQSLVAICLSSMISVGALAQAPSTQGYKVEGFASCGLIDQIPWAFRKGKRQSRLLIRDKMRLSTQSEFGIWEIHQVLDAGGYVAYVFKRTRDDGIMEALVTKESYYNRILDNGKERRIAEVRNLKPLIDRPVLSFYTQEGASVVFKPSLGGLARLQINFSGGVNRMIPPVELIGRSCDRHHDKEGLDISKPNSNPAAAPAAAAASEGAAK